MSIITYHQRHDTGQTNKSIPHTSPINKVTTTKGINVRRRYFFVEIVVPPASLLWLHSGGAFNKEPENDLGNYPSKFQISGEPSEEVNTMNNFFDDVMPEETGMIDYRCFYLWNPNTIAAMESIELELEQCDICGSDITYGSKLQNDIQTIEIICNGGTEEKPATPNIGGFVIFDTEFGAPFTVFWKGNYCTFGADLQARLNEQPWCEEVTVTGCNPYEVEFKGGVGNRNVCIMRVVQNDLVNLGLCRYNTQIYFACDVWNGYMDSIILTVQPISDHVPQSGILRIYNPLTGLWDAYGYDSHDDYSFDLTSKLQFNLVGFLGSCPPVGLVRNPKQPDPTAPDAFINLYNDPKNWQRWYPSPVYYGGNPPGSQPLPVPWGVIEAPCDKNYCQVCIVKKKEGSPINSIAKPILTEFTMPDSEFSKKKYQVGNLKPNEGFFWWTKRTTPSVINCCLRDYFDIRVTGTKVTWPLITGS